MDLSNEGIVVGRMIRGTNLVVWLSCSLAAGYMFVLSTTGLWGVGTVLFMTRTYIYNMVKLVFHLNYRVVFSWLKLKMFFISHL